jgi:cytochrome c biogenesis protein CcdA
MTFGALGLAFLAGLLSILSPCVLPLLPIILGAAATEHKLGPALLAAGVAVSFVVIGLFVATIGFEIGLDGAVFRNAAAVLMILAGVVLAAPALQVRAAAAGGPFSNWVHNAFGGVSTSGPRGQLAMGLLLGAVGSPCVGPTLGAASVLAARGENLTSVSATLGVFGIGAETPLLALGMMSRQAMSGWRDRLLTAGKGAKMALGALLVAIGFLIVTQLDKELEAVLVAASPAWLTAITTRF